MATTRLKAPIRRFYNRVNPTFKISYLIDKLKAQNLLDSQNITSETLDREAIKSNFARKS